MIFVILLLVAHPCTSFLPVSLPQFMLPQTTPDPDTTTAISFTNDEADLFTGLQLPGFLPTVEINQTEVVENLTSAETEFAQLRTQMNSVQSASLSDTEVEGLVSQVQGYLSEMDVLEFSINELEQLVLDFESSSTEAQSSSSQQSSSSSTSATGSSQGFQEDDQDVIMELETAMSGIAAQIHYLENMPVDLMTKVAEISEIHATLLESQPSAEVVEAVQTRIAQVESELTSQLTTFADVSEKVEEQCSKLDQQSNMFPTKRTGESGNEEDYLTIATASQSSVSDSNAAYRAIDGNFDWTWHSWGSCSVTQVEYYTLPWYMVELAANSRLTAVEITTSGESDALAPLQVDGFIEVDSYGTAIDPQICLYHTNYIARSSTFKQSCTNPIMAKYVRLTRRQQASQIALCELRLKGVTNYRPYPNMEITHSSSDSITSSAAMSSDGISGTCSMTMLDPLDSAPWWQIDMQGERTLRALTITNRGDDFYLYMRDLKVSVLPTSTGSCTTTSASTECAYYKGPAGVNEKVRIECEEPTTGQTVRVGRQDVPNEALSICEVELDLVD